MAGTGNGLARIFQQIQNGDWISKAVEAAYLDDRAERWAKPSIEVHPSSAGSHCPRDIELYLLGHRTPMQAKNRRRVDNGKAAHERWTRYFTDLGLLIVADFRHKVRGLWSGECDLVLRNPMGRATIVEIKTMNSNRWRMVPEQAENRQVMGEIMANFESAYTYQLVHYWVMIRSELPQPSEECAFLFENTDTQEFKIRYFIPTPELVIKAFANSTAARTAAIEGRLLEPPFKMQSAPCRKCYREHVCYALQMGDAEAQAAVDCALQQLEAARLELGRNEPDPSADPLLGAGLSFLEG